LKIRDLKQRVGASVVSSWPPVWAAFDGREHHGRLKWDPPPSIETVAKILSANVGQKLRAIGALDIDSEQSRA